MKRDSRLSFDQDPGLLAGFGLELLRLLFDRGEQRGPVRAERARSNALQAFGEGVGIDPGVSYRGDALLRRRVIGSRRSSRVPWSAKASSVFSGTVSMVLGQLAAQIVGVGKIWVLGLGGCPPQPLRTRAGFASACQRLSDSSCKWQE